MKQNHIGLTTSNCPILMPFLGHIEGVFMKSYTNLLSNLIKFLWHHKYKEYIKNITP